MRQVSWKERRRGARAWSVAALVVLAAAGIVVRHSREDSASFDEPVHILAAAGQVFRGQALANIEHPPLAKEVAGLGLLPLRSRLGIPPLPIGGPFFSGTRVLAHDFLFRNGASADEILAHARAPMLAFFAALLLLVFGAARRFFGTAAGLAALALIAFSPNFLAHAGVVHTDVPVSLFWLAAMLAWARVLDRASPGAVIAAGVLVGAALATKFSAVLLPPSMAAVAVGWRFLDRGSGAPGAGAPRRWRRDILAGAAVTAVAVAAAALLTWPAVAGETTQAQKWVIEYRVGRGHPAIPEARIPAALSDVSRPLAQLLGGVACVWRSNAAGGVPKYLDGTVSRRGFPTYFPVAFGVKSMPPFLLAVLLALALRIRRLDRIDVLLYVPVALYFAASVFSSYNIGVRHLLPVDPFLAIAASRVVPEAAARLRGRSAALRRAAATGGIALFGIWPAAIAVRADPYYLSYFNPFGGGMAGGSRILSDSNVDWGLDLKRLAGELGRRGITNPTVAYFGGDDVFARLGVPDWGVRMGPPGRFVAISETLWALGPAYYADFGRPDIAAALASLIERLKREGRLVGRVGYSIRLYEIRTAPPK